MSSMFFFFLGASQSSSSSPFFFLGASQSSLSFPFFFLGASQSSSFFLVGPSQSSSRSHVPPDLPQPRPPTRRRTAQQSCDWLYLSQACAYQAGRRQCRPELPAPYNRRDQGAEVVTPAGSGGKAFSAAHAKASSPRPVIDHLEMTERHSPAR